jgi:hypothetical protein
VLQRPVDKALLVASKVLVSNTSHHHSDTFSDMCHGAEHGTTSSTRHPVQGWGQEAHGTAFIYLCFQFVDLSNTSLPPTADWAPPLSTYTHTRRLHSLCRSWNSSPWTPCHPEALVRQLPSKARRHALRVLKATYPRRSNLGAFPSLFEVWMIFPFFQKFSIF